MIKRFPILLLFLLLCASAAFAQSSGPSIQVINTILGVKCRLADPIIWIVPSGGAAGVYRCSALNTLTLISGQNGVQSFNTRTGTVTLTNGDVLTAIGFTPLNPSNNLSDVASASTSRANLGLAIGTNVQAFNANLATIAGLSPSNDDILQRKAGAWINRTPAQLKVDLSLDQVSNTSDATKNSAVAVVTNKDLSSGTNTFPTSLATLTGAQSLTNKKLGSLTTNGFVKTSGGDGTLLVDTNVYATANSTTNFIPYLSAAGVFSDSPLVRASANKIEQRNGANPQELWLYSSYTDASNYEALFFKTLLGTYEIGTKAAGTGSFRNIRFRGAGTYSFALGDATIPTLDINPGNPTDINNLTGGIEFYAQGDTNKLTMRSPVEFGDASSGGSFRFNPGAASKPTCNSANDGRVWFTKGGTGVADTFEICGKSAADVYAWKTIVSF